MKTDFIFNLAEQVYSNTSEYSKQRDSSDEKTKNESLLQSDK